MFLRPSFPQSRVERVAETLRTQKALAGASEQEIEATIKTYRSLFSALEKEDSLESILSGHPEVASLVNPAGRIMDDRTAAYWQASAGQHEVVGGLLLDTMSCPDPLQFLRLHHHADLP